MKIPKSLNELWGKLLEVTRDYIPSSDDKLKISKTGDIETLQDLVESFSDRHERIAISWKEGQEIKTKSYIELYTQISNYSKGFLELGLEQGDRIALFAGNAPEWIGLSLGINYAGLIDVPRGEDTNIDEIKYIINYSDPKIVIVQNKDVLDKVKRAIPDIDLDMLVSMESIEGIRDIHYIENLGKQSTKKIPKVKADDSSSIIYTSGTTDEPLGVELTHGNFASNLIALRGRVPVTYEDKFFSLLPPWHIFDRMEKYGAFVSGAETFFSTPNPKIMFRDLLEQKPTTMGSVPLIWERIYDNIKKKANSEGRFRSALLKYAMKNIPDYSTNSGPGSVKEALSLYVLEKYVFPKLRKGLGGNFNFAVSGGGTLPPVIDNFYHAADIELLDGYGSTECLVISIRVAGRKSLKTIGPPLEGIEVKVLDSETGEEMPQGEEGVFYIKGPNVMKGYYKNVERTREVLSEDGWFNTGDIGYFDNKGNLVFTGRVKEIITLKSGVNVPPAPIESALKTSDYISEVVVVGQDWDGLGALIIPDREYLERYCKQMSIPYPHKDIKKILDNTQIKDLYKDEVRKRINTENGFKKYEIIRDFILLCNPFQIGRELTATNKVKRRVFDDIYSSQMQKMYDTIHGK